MDRRFSGILLLLCLSGCSSIHAGFEAVSAEGLRPDEILACADRDCFEGLPDTDITARRDLADGTSETDYRFQVKENRGWALARSVGHYLLGMATFGAWEVVGGTPIEAGLEVLGNRRYTAQVWFDSSGRMLELRPEGRLKAAAEAITQESVGSEEGRMVAQTLSARNGGPIWAEFRPSAEAGAVARAPGQPEEPREAPAAFRQIVDGE